ncbi:MAG: hypothetical protein ACYDCL_21730 [Myxococcales bacterium]
MSQVNLAAAALALECVAAAVSPPAAVPRTETESAAGAPVILPEAIRGRVALLIVGFTKASAGGAKAWEAALRERHGADPRVAIERIAVLESVPRLLRGLVRRMARGQEAPERLGSFLLLFNSEAAWKTLAGFEPRAADAAYLLVVDRQGLLRWRTHQAATPGGPPAVPEGLEDEVRGLLRPR